MITKFQEREANKQLSIQRMCEILNRQPEGKYFVYQRYFLLHDKQTRTMRTDAQINAFLKHK